MVLEKIPTFNEVKNWANTNFNNYTFSENHGDLTGLGSSDHHSRYSDSEARTAVDGSTVSVGYADSSGNGVPSNAITMWSGSTSSIPTGWSLCDGTDGTPDLRNRFVVGAGGQYGVGSTGGQDSVQLTIAEMPSHDHDYQNLATNNQESYGNDWSSPRNSYQTLTTTPTGGDEAHENRPPFYALAYIMKL